MASSAVHPAPRRPAHLLLVLLATDPVAAAVSITVQLRRSASLAVAFALVVVDAVLHETARAFVDRGVDLPRRRVPPPRPAHPSNGANRRNLHPAPGRRWHRRRAAPQRDHGNFLGHRYHAHRRRSPPPRDLPGLRYTIIVAGNVLPCPPVPAPKRSTMTEPSSVEPSLHRHTPAARSLGICNRRGTSTYTSISRLRLMSIGRGQGDLEYL